MLEKIKISTFRNETCFHSIIWLTFALETILDSNFEFFCLFSSRPNLGPYRDVPMGAWVGRRAPQYFQISKKVVQKLAR